MLITLTGRSGAGKDLLAANLHKARGAELLEILTTYPAMQSPIGDAYRTIGGAEFDSLVQSGMLFSHFISAAGYQYGVRQESIDRALEDGLSVAILGTQEALRLQVYAAERGKGQQVLSLYLQISDEQELARRLRERGESEQKIRSRLERERTSEAPGHGFCIVDASQTPEHCLETALAFYREHTLQSGHQ